MAVVETVVAVEPELLPRAGGWRLRCPNLALEADYRRWRAERAVPFTRVAMVASILGWIAFAVASVQVGPHLSRLVLPAALLLIAPTLAAVLVIAQFSELRAWVLPASAAANLFGGLTTVFILDRAGQAVGGAGYTDVGTAAIVLFVYYGCTIIRLPPATAAVAITPYVLMQQAFILDSFTGDPARRIAFSVVLWVAVVSGLLLSWVLERVSRDTFRQERVIESQQRVIEQERERSERLLLGILPGPIAERLKTEPGTIAEAHDHVTVLFADVVGFTALASRITATELVALLNEVFSRFDRLVAEHGVEKIKTIGDAYMAVAGVPEPRADHARAMADLALAMRAAVRTLASETRHALDFRIGLHTGPVIAGVIGTSKFAYDLWGDTVNMAARMESHGVPGEIQVTEELARLLRPHGYGLRARGPVEVKGRGAIPTWFLDNPPQ